MTLTSRQKQVLDAIRRFTSAQGYAPTIQNLMDEFGYASKNGVVCHLKALRTKGQLTWDENTARSLRLTGTSKVTLTLDSAIQKSLTAQAKRAGKSLNQFCIDVLNERAQA